MQDRNAIHATPNWTGRTPRTESEAFPRTISRYRPRGRRVEWGKVASYALALVAGSALGAVVVMFT